MGLVSLSQESHQHSEPALQCLHSGMESLQQIQPCLVHPSPEVHPSFTLPFKHPLHPSQLIFPHILIFPLLCPAAQGCFPSAEMFFQWQQLVPGCGSCHIKASSSRAERFMAVVKVLYRAFQSKCCRALRGLHQNTAPGSLQRQEKDPQGILSWVSGMWELGPGPGRASRGKG